MELNNTWKFCKKIKLDALSLHNRTGMLLPCIIRVICAVASPGIRGAMVARLTPDQKVACSIHVGFKPPNLVRIIFLFFEPFILRHLSQLSHGPANKVSFWTERSGTSNQRPGHVRLARMFRKIKMFIPPSISKRHIRYVAQSNTGTEPTTC